MARYAHSSNATRSHFSHSARLVRSVNLNRSVPRGGFRF